MEDEMSQRNEEPVQDSYMDEGEEKEVKETLPEYITLLADGNMQIETRQGVFIIEEPEGAKFDQVERLAAGHKMTDFKKTIVLIARCLVDPKLGDAELLQNYKLSTLQRLAAGMQIFVDESKSFLMTPDMPSKEPNGKKPNAKSVFGFGKRLTN